MSPAPARSGASAGAGLTALYLLGGIAVGLGLALPVSAIPTPGHPHILRNTLSGLILLAVVLLASHAWGRALGRRAGVDRPARLGTRAALSFAPVMMTVAIVLGLLEPVFVKSGAARGYPLHVVFGMLFVPATFLVTGVTALVMGRALLPWGRAVRLALAAGAAAALAFLAVDVGMDAIGWRVGAPGAADRATMLVVTLLGCLAAALAGGAVLGKGLGNRLAV